MIALKKIGTIAVAASVALTPMLALADDGATTSASIETHAGYKFPNIFGRKSENEMHSTTSASTTGDNGFHKGEGQNLGNGAHLEARANASIDARIDLLKRLEDRINSAKRFDSDSKSDVIAMLTAQIQALTDLKAKIGNDTSTSTMRDDAGKIRPEFRTYALVLPQAAITAMADHILTIAAQMDTLGSKLSTRIDAAATAGVNVDTARSAYSDYTAKVTDAKTQANAALSLVANLKADNGDKTIFAANAQALKDAKTKLQAARTDLEAARKDVDVIAKIVKKTGVNTTASSTTTVK